MLLIPKDGSRVDHADWVGLEQEAGDNTEISAASAERPEEIGVLRLAGSDETPVREDHIGLDEVIAGEAKFAGQIASPAPER